MSASEPVSAPQELLDWLTSQGVDPATVSYWQLLVHTLRRQNKIAQQVQANTADIAAIKTKLNMT